MSYTFLYIYLQKMSKWGDWDVKVYILIYYIIYQIIIYGTMKML